MGYLLISGINNKTRSPSIFTPLYKNLWLFYVDFFKLEFKLVVITWLMKKRIESYSRGILGVPRLLPADTLGRAQKPRCYPADRQRCIT